MPGKHFDLDLDKTLGGEQASDITIASQKAVKSYVDKSHEDLHTLIQILQQENNQWQSITDMS
jgi:hypothetical protein